MIRRLREDEPIPDGVPRRYRNRTSGYVFLRWRVGPSEYVEIAEHRRVAGRHKSAVHHINHDRSDNRPENLLPVTSAEHGEEHRKWDVSAAKALYEQGWNTLTLAERFSVTPGQVSRMLRKAGVKMRSATDYKTLPIDRDRVRALFVSGLGRRMIATALGCSSAPIQRVLKELGLRRKVGRVAVAK